MGALLKQWGEGPASIGAFMALVSLPWMLKPLFGLLSDFVPLYGAAPADARCEDA